MTATLFGFGLFEDQLFSATDLQRRCSTVLDSALLGPVTISRNNEQFAVLKREQAKNLIHQAQSLLNIMTVMFTIRLLCEGGQPPAELSWLGAYEKDELEELEQEISQAFHVSDAPERRIAAIEAILDEYKASSLASSSGKLDEALRRVVKPIKIQDNHHA